MADCAGGRMLVFTCADASDGQRPRMRRVSQSAIFRLRWFHVKRGTLRRAEIDDPRPLR